jgi:Glycosyl transferases group 1
MHAPRDATKPKLVFFRWPSTKLPHFVRLHLREQERCLAQFFEIVVISVDCDYRQVCEEHEPDLTLFESGVYAGERDVRNTSACPEIPKLGFCNADAYCKTRSVFLSDMERWGVDTFFTLSVSMAEYTPEIADRLFVWPNFVDGELYRDYGEAKTIPVLLTGSRAAHYPWRNQVAAVVSPHFPTVSLQHRGWFDQRAAAAMVYGERYARLLNAASFVPTCGTIAREVVRKHFEIPAARACLVTERTASAEAAGFADMENCVFADPADVLDKLDYLLRNRDELARITDAGHQLVHSRHTMRQRDQLLQWFTLHRGLRSTEKIVQAGPFEALTVVPSTSAANNVHAISGGLDRALLRQGDDERRAARYDRAEELYLRCLDYHFMPEPILELALCHLHRGNATAAIEWLAEPIWASLKGHLARDPDPVEWAYFIRALLCRGRVADAVRRAGQFPTLRHPELDRIRQILTLLGHRDGDRSSEGDGVRRRASVHVLPEQPFRVWLDDLCRMLAACGQQRLAMTIRGSTTTSGLYRPSHPGVAPRGSTRHVSRRIFPLVPMPLHTRVRRRVERWLRSAMRHRAAQAEEAPEPAPSASTDTSGRSVSVPGEPLSGGERPR